MPECNVRMQSSIRKCTKLQSTRSRDTAAAAETEEAAARQSAGDDASLIASSYLAGA